MNLTQAKEKLAKIEWYKQGAAVKPLYISYPWHACSLMSVFGRKINVRYNINLFYKNNLMDDYISKESLSMVADFYYSRQHQDGGFIIELYKYWHKNCVENFKKQNIKLFKLNFLSLSNNELLKIFNDYSDAYLKVWQEAIFLDGFDYYGEIVMEKLLKKENKNIAPDDLSLLLTPPCPSFLQKERLEILSIVEKIAKIKFAPFLNEKGLLAESKKKSWFEKKLDGLSKKYYWLNNDYASVEYLDKKYFFKKVLLLLENEEKMEEEKMMRRDLKNLKVKKLKIIKKYKLSSEFVSVMNFLAFLGNFRDERKTYNQMAGNILLKFASELSKRAGLPLTTIEHLFFWEIKDIFNSNRQLTSIVNNRKKGAFFLITAPEKSHCFYGEDAGMLGNLMKSLVRSAKGKLLGKPAFAGKAKGRVKIINGKNDFNKMERGDILVAANTRPEFVPIMKIAGAIITEEGGITCHAAIVSRELKVPCVVGIQGAIAQLKDGDMAEVDAEKGVVRIIK